MQQNKDMVNFQCFRSGLVCTSGHAVWPREASPSSLATGLAIAPSSTNLRCLI